MSKVKLSIGKISGGSVSVGQPTILPPEQPKVGVQFGQVTSNQDPGQLPPLGDALKQMSASNQGQGQPPPNGPPLQAPAIPFREFYALAKGDPAKMEAIVPGISSPKGYKLLVPGPDGTPHVPIAPNKVAMLKEINKIKPADRPMIPSPGYPEVSSKPLKRVSAEGAFLMKKYGITADELYNATSHDLAHHAPLASDEEI